MYTALCYLHKNMDELFYTVGHVFYGFSAQPNYNTCHQNATQCNFSIKKLHHTGNMKYQQEVFTGEILSSCLCSDSYYNLDRRGSAIGI